MLQDGPVYSVRNCRKTWKLVERCWRTAGRLLLQGCDVFGWIGFIFCSFWWRCSFGTKLENDSLQQARHLPNSSNAFFLRIFNCWFCWPVFFSAGVVNEAIQCSSRFATRCRALGNCRSSEVKRSGWLPMFGKIVVTGDTRSPSQRWLRGGILHGRVELLHGRPEQATHSQGDLDAAMPMPKNVHCYGW